VLWVGGAGGMEYDLVQRAGVAFEAIPAAGLHGVGLRALPGNLLQLGRGMQAAGRILRRFRPDVLFFTGGYVAGPFALVGRRAPIALYVPDIEPGLALKGLARFADRIAVTAAESRSFFSKKARLEVTGYPVRPDLDRWTRPGAQREARQLLGLQPDLPSLLVFGGSKGARSINRALLACLPGLLPEMQVLHLSGSLDWPEVQAAQAALPKQIDPSLAGRYHAYAYLHEEMAAALASADLVVSRAGASTLGEFPLFGLPAILVPYPYAWRYQRVNAQYLEQRGAATLLPDEEMPARLAGLVLELTHAPQRLEAMRQAARRLARPEAAQAVAQVLIDLATVPNRKGSDR
jgi:UDP-N-acetylglucosamine--N-acetylmuramyl-(pentapeptide) pyrophosphoryl-undecaprenol N-acetylglucosamine transferase